MNCYSLLFKEKGLHPEKFQSYLNTFRYGCPPHGGFGIGLERIVYKLLELTNVREASVFREIVLSYTIKESLRLSRRFFSSFEKMKI